MARPQTPTAAILRWQAGGWAGTEDQLAAEEPLELLLDGEPLSVVMRTPGADVELALGLLWAERVITSLEGVRSVRISAEAEEAAAGVVVEAVLVESNRVDVRLSTPPMRRPARSYMSSSACGVCGATTLDELALDLSPVADGPVIDPADLPPLVDELRARQELFDRTGGLHAAGLFEPGGRLVTLREDVGRHNAVDKVVGRALLDARLPADAALLAVSGRAGYEVVQKAVAAGIPIVAAVGAPSSLAVATARRFGVTLVGFLRPDRMNVYSAPERLSANRSA